MSYPCGLCKKDYSSIKRLEKHKCSFCFYCQRSYSTKQKYDSHSCVGKKANEILNLSLENSGNSNHVCEWCKKGFSSLNYLAAHKCPYCAVCDHIFASYQKYEMHKRKCARLHTPADVEPVESLPPPEPTSTPVVTDYKCELCKKYFSSPKYLATHKCAYCEPCKRSFATFQKFRMHRLKCTRSIHYENSSESIAATDMINENVNSLEDVVAARGSFITRKVISRMAMLELLRRRSGLSSINDLMLSPEGAVVDACEADDQPEDLTCKQRTTVSLSDDTDREGSRCIGGETTNYLLSRLSVSGNIHERERDSKEDTNEGDHDRTKVSSPYFIHRISDEYYDDDSKSIVSLVSSKIDRREQCHERTEQIMCVDSPRKQSPDFYVGRGEQLPCDIDRVGVKSLCDEDVMQEEEEESPDSNERTREQSPCSDERTGEHSPYEMDRLGTLSPCNDKDVRLSPNSNERIMSRLSPHCVRELPEEEFDVRSETPLAVHPPHTPEASDVALIEHNDATMLHQSAVVARLMEAVRSQFLLSAGSPISNHHFLDDSHESYNNQTKEWTSEMPRAKLIDSKPRGRMSAYAFFVQTCREEHKKKHPDENVVFSEFSRKCADRWKTMTDKEKNRFYEMAEKDKDRYENEMKGYRGPRTTRGSRKRRNRKDPNAPKRALSAFFWFCNDERPKVRAVNPEMGVGDIAKQLGAAWGVTPPDVKSKYEAMAEYDKGRYEREMKAFKEGNFVAKKQKTATATPTPTATATAPAPEDKDDDDDDDSESEEEEEEDDEVE